MEHISLSSDVIFSLWGIPFTNSVLAGFLCSFVIIIIAIIIRIGAGIIPTRRQLAFEMIVDMFQGGITTAFGSEKRGNTMMYVFLTIFFFLLVANQFFVFPLINQLVVEMKNHGEVAHVALFRLPTTDLSLPFALAASLILGGHLWAFISHPFRYLGHIIRVKGFFTLKSPGDIPLVFVELFLGLMEVISECAKIVSLSARLFGNLFAGEVMYLVIVALVAYIAPIPIVVLALLTGLVQAFVFVTLSYQFMGTTVTSVDSHHS